MGLSLSIEEKQERVVKFLSKLSENNSISLSAIAMETLKTSDALFAFERLGLFQKVNGQWTAKKALADFDLDTVKLMAMESWFIDRTKRIDRFEQPAENVAPSPSISHTEEIAKYMAKIGDLLGFQFAGKTPPGLWQMIQNQEAELQKLRKEKAELLKDIEMLTNIKSKYHK